MPRPSSCVSPAAGIVCSNTDLISILSSLTSSATEINRCGDDSCPPSRDDVKSAKTLEQKRSRLKDFRSNSFDVSILHGTGNKSVPSGNGSTTKASGSSSPAPVNWFINRHQPMWKKQKSQDMTLPILSFKFEKSKVMKAVKDSLTRSTSPPRELGQTARHKVVWDGTRGTKVDAQVLGSAIEEFLTSQRGGEIEASGAGGSAAKPTVSPAKHKSSGKATSWLASGKDEEKAEACDASICPSLKDLFVK